MKNNKIIPQNIHILNNNSFYIRNFNSFNEIKESLIYLEDIYLKDKNFLFFKISHIKKRNVISDLRLYLSGAIFNYISKNSISNTNLSIIQQFYFKYFFLSDKEIYYKPSSIFAFIFDGFTGYSPDYCEPKDFDTCTLKDDFSLLSIQMQNYFKKLYYYLLLIIILEDELLFNNFLNYFPLNSNFYYYFIQYYITKENHNNNLNIKYSNIMYIILLNIKQEKIKNMAFYKIKYNLNIFFDLMKYVEERENLRVNIEHF